MSSQHRWGRAGGRRLDHARFSGRQSRLRVALIVLSGLAVVTGMIAGVLGLRAVPAAHAATVIAQGDLAVSLGSEVDEYTPTGSFVQHLVTPADGLAYATGSAFDGNGNLYVTDFSNNQILKRDAISGTVTVFASNATLGGGHVFDAPESIVFDKGYQHMYVSDANRFGPGGGINVINMATGQDAAFYPLPSSNGWEGNGESDWLAFDAASNLYMTNESPAQGVMRVDPTTGDIVQPSLVANLPTFGYALSFDHNGNLWVGDTNSILEYTPSGALVRQITNPSFSLVFAAVFNAAGDQFYAGDLGNGQVYRYDLSGNLLGSFSTSGSVAGLSVAGAAVPPNSGGPTDITLPNTKGSNEPSVAVDPRNPNHVVIGYNQTTANFTSQCTWSETTDGGATWQQGVLPGMAQSNYGTDPTVRFASDGTLYYSCMVIGGWSLGLHASARDVDILLYSSSSGRASQFGSDATVVDGKHQTCPHGVILNAAACKNIGTPFDHPSLVMAQRPGDAAGTATRAAICWTAYAGKAPSNIFTDWIDPNGNTGGKQAVGNGAYCFMSGPPALTAVSFLDGSGTFVAVKTSFDGGDTWSQVVTFPTPGLLTLPGTVSTDASILSVPYALTVSDGAGGVHVIVSDRTNNQDRVYVADSAVGYTQTAVLSEQGSGSFLPGVGNCSTVVGAYERTTAGYGYTVWVRDTAGHYTPAFATSHDMGPGYPYGAGYTRIGDYTDAGCVGTTAWVAWTDSHNGQLTIHTVRLTIS